MTERALVLGGGGITGIAWELGLLAGLAERGVVLSGAGLIIGTSAGSVVGAQIATGVDVEERYTAQLAPPDGEVVARFGRATMVRLGLAMIGPAMIGRGDARRVRSRIGSIALRTRTVPESERIAVIARRLPVREWPERALRVTAVDAHTGEFVVLDRDSGVSLVEAVAASCAVPGVWPPVTAGGRRFIDGGMRSTANADLAGGSARVVVLAPVTRGIGPLTGVAPQVAGLRAAGARVALVSPDEAAVRAIGRNVLDPTRRAAAARAGRVQAAAVADEVTAVWED
ncbi:MAG: patatin-like phospholipase family protein [Pseudonocardia sp.]|nr:patatin-like phospholipase family protein [Pseudonocardia sp.]